MSGSSYGSGDMRGISGVYIIANELDDCAYIGSSRNIRRRWAEHIYCLECGTHPNQNLQVAYAKHGISAFSFKLLEIIKDPRSILEDREQHWLDLRNSTGGAAKT